MTAVVATPGVGTASIAFTTAFDGNSPITGYTATCSPAFPPNLPATGTNTASPIVVTGLANGVTYTCTVTATNALGTSAASAPSAGFAHQTVPQAPTGVVATPATGFGAAGEGFVRLTVCADKARLAEAVDRLAKLAL